MSDAGVDRSAAAFEASGVEPVFCGKEHAIGLRTEPRVLPLREIRVLDSSGNVERTIAFSEADRKL